LAVKASLFDGGKMMTKEQILEVVQAHYEALNWGELHEVVGLIAKDFIWRNRATNQAFRGPDGYLAYLDSWHSAFPDFWVEISHLTIGSQSVVCEYVLRGTHNGPLTTPSTPIPATGRQIELFVCDTFRVENGRLASANTYFDLTTLLQQLGLLMKPGTARMLQEVLLTPITYQN
jgi:steroid delta-isomerase-like uncharacterized protein